MVKRLIKVDKVKIFKKVGKNDGQLNVHIWLIYGRYFGDQLLQMMQSVFNTKPLVEPQVMFFTSFGPFRQMPQMIIDNQLKGTGKSFIVGEHLFLDCKGMNE